MDDYPLNNYFFKKINKISKKMQNKISVKGSYDIEFELRNCESYEMFISWIYKDFLIELESNYGLEIYDQYDHYVRVIFHNNELYEIFQFNMENNLKLKSAKVIKQFKKEFELLREEVQIKLNDKLFNVTIQFWSFS
jgi:hypothetical protein